MAFTERAFGSDIVHGMVWEIKGWPVRTEQPGTKMNRKREKFRVLLVRTALNIVFGTRNYF